MATKDLARTFVEGGRAKSVRGKYQRTINRLRMEHRVFCRRVAVDPERFGDELAPELAPVRGWDTTSRHGTPAISRWLDAHVGRPWDKAYAKLCRRYDARTKLGQKMRDEVLWRICVNPNDCRRSWREYVVDEGGILRANAWDAIRSRERRERIAPRDVREQTMRDLAAFCGDMKVGARNGRLFWFVPAEQYRIVAFPDQWVRVGDGLLPKCGRERVPTGGYRQDQPLTEDETRHWNEALKTVDEMGRQKITESFLFAVREAAHGEKRIHDGDRSSYVSLLS